MSSSRNYYVIWNTPIFVSLTKQAVCLSLDPIRCCSNIWQTNFFRSLKTVRTHRGLSRVVSSTNKEVRMYAPFMSIVLVSTHTIIYPKVMLRRDFSKMEKCQAIAVWKSPTGKTADSDFCQRCRAGQALTSSDYQTYPWIHNPSVHQHDLLFDNKGRSNY